MSISFLCATSVFISSCQNSVWSVSYPGHSCSFSPPPTISMTDSVLNPSPRVQTPANEQLSSPIWTPSHPLENPESTNSRDTLLKAAETLHGKRLKDFLSTWRQDICNELIHSLRGFLTSRQPHLAAQISTEFPNCGVLHLYVYPLTSYSPTKTPPDTGGNYYIMLANMTSVHVRQHTWHHDLSSLVQLKASWLNPSQKTHTSVFGPQHRS